MNVTPKTQVFFIYQFETITVIPQLLGQLKIVVTGIHYIIRFPK